MRNVWNRTLFEMTLILIDLSKGNHRTQTLKKLLHHYKHCYTLLGHMSIFSPLYIAEIPRIPAGEFPLVTALPHFRCGLAMFGTVYL